MSPSPLFRVSRDTETRGEAVGWSCKWGAGGRLPGKVTRQGGIARQDGVVLYLPPLLNLAPRACGCRNVPQTSQGGHQSKMLNSRWPCNRQGLGSLADVRSACTMVGGMPNGGACNLACGVHAVGMGTHYSGMDGGWGSRHHVWVTRRIVVHPERTRGHGDMTMWFQLVWGLSDQCLAHLEVCPKARTHRLTCSTCSMGGDTL